MGGHVDVIIVGAGLSGIGAAWHLQARCPDRSYLILEARGAIGGTWDLFRYPGIRSDSDMHTLGYAFRPWTGAQAIADGPAIRRYIEETARAGGIDRRIRYHRRVTAASWSGAAACWTVETDGPGGAATLTCGFLYVCAGYYAYDRGHAPDFPGRSDFAGAVVHPQFWPDDFDPAGRRIVVIGSGATAMTLVPALARTAAQVTMLQRSPSYVVARPSRDRIADALRRLLPAAAAYAATRWKNVAAGMAAYHLMRRYPRRARARLIAMVRDRLGADHDVATHFTPSYDPWDQRLCLVPDGDLFDAIGSGRARIETGTIDRFTADGVRLAGGRELPADVIVTATGLELSLLGGIALRCDGVPVRVGESFQYKGMMLSDVPNLAFAFGYTNASWTLKADLVAAYVCRLLNRMRREGWRQATPRIGRRALRPEPFAALTSGYIRRALDRLPKQGHRRPWRLHQNYLLDLLDLRFGSLRADMEFSNPAPGGRRGA